MAVKHAAEDQRADDVLIAADDGQETVDPRSARVLSERPRFRRQDVERERHVQFLRRSEDGHPDRVVIVGLARISGHHHALEPRDVRLPQFVDADRLRLHRDLG
jgi:hypothetical protein